VNRTIALEIVFRETSRGDSASFQAEQTQRDSTSSEVFSFAFLSSIKSSREIFTKLPHSNQTFWAQRIAFIFWISGPWRGEFFLWREASG